MLSLDMEGFLIKWSRNMHVICVWEWFPLSRKSDPVWQAAGTSICCCCRLVRKEESNMIFVTSSWRWHEERTARRSFPKFRRHWFQKRACCCWVSGCKPNPQAEPIYFLCVLCWRHFPQGLKFVLNWRENDCNKYSELSEMFIDSTEGPEIPDVVSIFRHFTQ